MKVPVRAKIAVLVAILMATPLSLSGQAARGSVTGIVTSAATLGPLSGVQVYIPGTGLGSLTNIQGRFLIANVPAGPATVKVEILGYVTASRTLTVPSGAAIDVSFQLEQTALALGEIVVTGVAAATPKAELPFTVDKLDFNKALAVVPTSPATMLQGRVAGVSVISGSGQPGEDADIVLRAPTSISGGQSPLLIIDGVITSGRLSDVNPQDIANIEVVKGAAAASLYGSRAQAGVINITTKRGGGLAGNENHFVMRTTYNKNNLEHALERATHHYYKMTADKQSFADKNGKAITKFADRVLDDGGDGSNAWKAFLVNDFPPSVPVYNPMDLFFHPGAETSTYGAVEGRQGSMNYRLSASIGHQGGVVRYDEGSKNKSFRMNLDSKVRSDLTVSFSGYFANVWQDLVDQGGGGILDNLSKLNPVYNLLEIDPVDGDLKASVGPPGNETTNILYTLKAETRTRDRNRYTGGLTSQYTPFSWLVIEGNGSYDRSEALENFLRPKGFKHNDSDGNALAPDVGAMSRSSDVVVEKNASVTASLNFKWSDFTSRSRLRYLYEDRNESAWSASGSSFAVIGVPQLGLLTGTSAINSSDNRTVAEGYFGITSVGYKSKYLVDFLLRRDGSSLFGENQRWQNYYRVSGAWRMAEESWWPVSWITEFKPRASQGTAGGRPRFEAQYQTYGVSRGQISPQVLGNKDLRPELARERELGVDATFGQRVTLTGSYINTTVEDELLQVPLPGYYGFTSQWRNAGTLKSKTWEATLEAAIVQRPNQVWTSTLNYSRTRQKITHLGVPPYQIRFYRSTMYVVEGQPLGSFFGKILASKCSDIPGITCSKFDVNDEGLLVYVGEGNTWKDGRAKNLWGTIGQDNGKFYNWGSPLNAMPWPEISKMGDSEPDFQLSWSNGVTIGKLGLNTLVEGVFGAQLYSTTLQFQSSGGDLDKEDDQTGKPEYAWKPLGYYFTLYDVNTNSNYWVKDASFVKIREVSLHYAFSKDQLSHIFGAALSPQQAVLNLSGKNLKTWTPYKGYDPEVGNANFLGSAVVGRIDEYSYPNFRSFGMDVELTF